MKHALHRPSIAVSALVSASASLLVAATDDGSRGAAQDAAAPEFARDVLPLLTDSCVVCHGGKTPEAGLSFERFKNEADARTAIGVWRKMRDKLGHGEMPPPEAPAPDAAQVERALKWLEVRLGNGPGSWPIDPGRVTIRRLNRAEYANTIRDLLDLDFDVASRLPPDDVGYGFDNIGDVLALPPLLLEKYVAVAEEIAAAALPGGAMRSAQKQHFEAESVHTTLKDARHSGVADLYSNGEVFTDVVLPRAGDYVMRARAWGDQAGPDPCKMGFRAANHELGRVDVPGRHDEAATYEWPAHLAGGSQRIAVSFLNDYYHPEDPDPKQRDRNLIIDWIEIEGPLDPLPPTPSERRLFVCGADHAHTRDCVPPLLKRFASRAWRRPVSELEVAHLMPFVDRARADGDDLNEALRVAIAAVLVSPNFLFRSELDPNPNDPAYAHELSDFELASRLSYFLWSSLPDDRLSSLAEQGLLREPATLADEARRLLRDPRASALVANFAGQWLELRSLATIAPDPKTSPDFDEELREAMRLETEMFVEAILREGRPVSELLDADFTFLNERLAKHYGVAGVKGSRMQRVRVTDPLRGGVLTQASILTLTSNPTRTSPVKRGKFLLERILNAPPPPPPPGVGVLDESPATAQALSLKERLERHRKDPSCAVCHARMDALGFALERFGPTGAARTSDGPHAIDDHTALPDGRPIDGPATLKQLVAQGDDFTRCLAEKLLVYAIGRGPSDDDRRALASLVKGYRGRSPSFEELIVGLTTLDAFRRRRGEAPADGN